jgi:putative NADH-flavin reductase
MTTQRLTIAVVAATGRSGQAFVHEAIGAGHHVIAGIHSNSPFTPDDHLTTIRCDATMAADIDRLTIGADVVASFIGHTDRAHPDVQTKATARIVAACERHGIARVISLTGTGVRTTGDRITLLDRFLNVSIQIIDPDRVSDGKNHADVLSRTNLEWTIIRVLKLQNTRPKAFELKLHGPAQTLVSRQEVARAVLQVIEARSFIREMPIISRP